MVAAVNKKEKKNYLHQMESEMTLDNGGREDWTHSQPTSFVQGSKRKQKKERDRDQPDRQLHRSPREKAAGLVIGHTNLFLVDHGSAEECIYTSFPFVVILSIFHPSNASIDTCKCGLRDLLFL